MNSVKQIMANYHPQVHEPKAILGRNIDNRNIVRYSQYLYFCMANHLKQ